MWRLLCSRQILLLTPLFLYLGWLQAYPGTLLATYFTVRARALGSLCYALIGSVGTWLAGVLVDVRWHRSRKVRAVTTFAVLAVLNSATWVWAVVIQDEYARTHPLLDWADQRAFGRGFGVYMFERLSFALVENYVYWCIGNLADSPGDQIRYSSLLRGIETAAVAVSFGVQAVPAPLLATAAINMGVWFASLPFAFYATLKVVRKFDELSRPDAEAGKTDSADANSKLDEKV